MTKNESITLKRKKVFWPKVALVSNSSNFQLIEFSTGWIFDWMTSQLVEFTTSRISIWLSFGLVKFTCCRIYNQSNLILIKFILQLIQFLASQFFKWSNLQLIECLTKRMFNKLCKSKRLTIYESSSLDFFGLVMSNIQRRFNSLTEDNLLDFNYDVI